MNLRGECRLPTVANGPWGACAAPGVRRTGYRSCDAISKPFIEVVCVFEYKNELFFMYGYS